MRKFPTKNIRQLIASDFVTNETRRVLLDRLDDVKEAPPLFFDEREFEILNAVCEILAPSKTVPRRFAANRIDKRLAENTGDGWRYDSMPSDGESYKTNLKILDDAARENFQIDFAGLDIERRKEIFNSQTKLAPSRFLEELCAEFAEIFYSHPLALEEIGYIGFADAHGWNLSDTETRRRGDTEKRVEIRQEISASPRLRVPSSSNETVDAVIIGTGAGGAPILARLAQAGLKVVALEAGKSFDFREFPTDERAQSKLFWTDERLSAGANAVAFSSNNSGCGVGGSTLHFTAYTPRPQADDFRIFSDFGVGRDWCLSYEDLEPYFDEIEWFLGVSVASPYPWGKPRKRNYPLPPLPLNGAARLMRTACEKLNIKTAPAPNAALSPPIITASRLTCAVSARPILCRKITRLKIMPTMFPI
jgi:hypothetical protein